MIKTLLSERRFSVLLAGNLMSKIGDGIHEFIFIISVLNVTNNSIFDAGVIYFFRFLPYLILGPIGGVLSDRLSRKMLMIGSDLLRMVVTTCFVLLLITDTLSMLSLAIIGMLMTTLRTIFQPAFQATIPSIVKAEHLPQVNGATQIASEIGGMIGPALGGLAFAFGISTAHVLVIDVMTYLISTICIVIITIPSQNIDKLIPLTIRNLYGDFGKNLMSVISKPQLIITILYSSVCILLVGSALRILIPAMMKDAGFSNSVIGYSMSLVALGTIAGAIICGKVVRDFNTRNLMIFWSLYGIALALLPLALIKAPVILMGCFVLGFVGAFVDVLLPTNIQLLSTNENIGKNFSLFSTLANTGEALSGGLVGIMVLFSSVTASVTLIGLLIAAVGYVGKRRSVTAHE